MNQSPSNLVGTGPPGGGLRAAVADDVDWPHDEARKTTAVASRAAIAGEPIHRGVVMVRPRRYKFQLESGANGDPKPLLGPYGRACRWLSLALRLQHRETSLTRRREFTSWSGSKWRTWPPHQPLNGGRTTVKTAPGRFPSNKSWP